MIYPAFRIYAIVTAVILISLLHSPLKAQTKRNFQVTGGLTTMWIVNENAALESIQPRIGEYLFGAGFDGQQLGVSVRLLYGIDTANRIRINTGLDYYFLRGVQRNQYTASASFYTYGVNMPTVVLGGEYAFVQYPPGNARIYGGLELRGAFTSAIPISQKLIRLSDNSVLQSENGFVKDNAFRLGGAVRLGIDGELSDPIFVNMSVAYGVVNLIGRDHTRGELLTPDNNDFTYDTHEGYIHNIISSFLIQYRF